MGQVNELPLWTQKCSVSASPRHTHKHTHSLTLECLLGCGQVESQVSGEGRVGKFLFGVGEGSLDLYSSLEAPGVMGVERGCMGVVAQEEWGEHLCPLDHS